MQLVNKNLYDDLDIEQRAKVVLDDITSAKELFETKQLIAERNARFVKDDQWTERERTLHRIQQRPCFTFNVIRRYVDHMIGTQIQTRMDAKLLPREPGDEKEVNLLQHILKWSEQNSDIEWIETGVFSDGVIKGFGAAVVRWKMEDLEFGFPYIEKIPNNQLYWDINAKKPDLSDCTKMWRIQTTTKKEAGEMFPDKLEEIYSETNTYYNVSVRTKREESAYNHDIDDLVDIVEHYEKVNVLEYLVSDSVSGNITRFIKENEAKEFHQGLIDQYSEDGVLLLDEQGNQLVRFMTLNNNRIFQTVMVGSTVIRAYLTSMNDFPFIVYFPYFDDGDYTAPVTAMIDPQVIINRMYSQWDLQVGKQAKQAMTVVKNLLVKDFSVENLRQEISKTAPIIPVLTHAAINPFPNQPVNPEMFNAIQWSMSAIEGIAGGKNLNGTGESASESGRAAAIRAEQGGLSRLPLYDNLRMWKRNVAYRMLWWIKSYMSNVQISRIVGHTDIEYVNVNDEYLDTLRELKVDIIIDEAVNSADLRARNLEQLTQIIQSSQGQVPAEVYMPMMIEMSEFPIAMKQKLLEQLDLNKKYMESQAQLAEILKQVKGVENSELRRKLKETIQYKEEIESATEDVEMATKELEKAKQEQQAMADKIPSQSQISNQLQLYNQEQQ